jgi:hypothetical protein
MLIRTKKIYGVKYIPERDILWSSVSYCTTCRTPTKENRGKGNLHFIRILTYLFHIHYYKEFACAVLS